MFLLERMGWKQGEGLGKNSEGKVEPLQLDFKVDRKGEVGPHPGQLQKLGQRVLLKT